MYFACNPNALKLRGELYAIVPSSDWSVWLDEYPPEEIAQAYTMLANYFFEDAWFTELPEQMKSQIKGRISQTLYLRKMLNG